MDDRPAHLHRNAKLDISYARHLPVLSDKSTTMENSRQESFKKVTEYANRISNSEMLICRNSCVLHVLSLALLGYGFVATKRLRTMSSEPSSRYTTS